MANVQAIQDFEDALNLATNGLLRVRDVMSAADTLWPSLTAGVKVSIRAQMQADLDAAKALVAALQVP